MTTDYRDFLTRVLSDEVTGPPVANVTADVMSNIADITRLRALTGGDPAGINGAIDAQLDRIIVACNGDMRLALFNLAAAGGSALTALLGARR